MKKLIVFTIVILGFLASACAHRSPSNYGYCGQTKVSPGERYKMVLDKCGEPDEYYYYENDLGLRIGTRIRYGLLDEESPTYLYFDRWGSCKKIAPVLKLTAFDAMPERFSGETRGQCRDDQIILVGTRLANVLHRCGNPDDYADFMNELGVKKAIELRYDQASDQFPIYFYFDRRGICTRIRTGNNRSIF